MTTTTNAENLLQYRSKFSLIVEQMLTLLRALTLLEKLRICLQMSNELHNDVLHYR